MWPFGKLTEILHEARALRAQLQKFEIHSAGDFCQLRKDTQALMSLGQDIIGELKALKALTLEENAEVKSEVGQLTAKIAELEDRLAATTVTEEEKTEIAGLISDLKAQIEGISETPSETPAE